MCTCTIAGRINSVTILSRSDRWKFQGFRWRGKKTLQNLGGEKEASGGGGLIPRSGGMCLAVTSLDFRRGKNWKTGHLLVLSVGAWIANDMGSLHESFTFTAVAHIHLSGREVERKT